MEANAVIVRSRGQREEQLVNHHVGGATNREAWNKLPTEVPEVGNYVVYKNETQELDMCVEGGMEHPWNVGLVLSIQANNTFRVHETGRPIAAEKDRFSIKNAYYLRYQVSKKDVNGVVVTQDVYKTKSTTIPCGAMRVESVISFDELAWWNTEDKVLTKYRTVRYLIMRF